MRMRQRTLPLILAVSACALAHTAVASASTASSYPAGATRPLRVAKPSELAHAAAAPTGGSSVPTAGSSKSATGSPKSTSKPKPKPKPKG